MELSVNSKDDAANRSQIININGGFELDLTNPSSLVQYFENIIAGLQKENWNTRKELELAKIRLESVTIQL